MEEDENMIGSLTGSISNAETHYPEAAVLKDARVKFLAHFTDSNSKNLHFSAFFEFAPCRHAFHSFCIGFACDTAYTGDVC